MSEISFNCEPHIAALGDRKGANVRGPGLYNALPTVMRRKFIGDTAGEIVRLSDIYRIPFPVERQLAENVNTGYFPVLGSDPVVVKFVERATDASASD